MIRCAPAHVSYRRRAGLWAMLALLAGGCENEKASFDVSYAGATMGTSWSVRLARCDRNPCTRVDAAALQGQLDGLTAIFSHYEKDSEVSAFNRRQDTDWFPVSPELALVAREALELSARSAGAFDITVAPLADAWGFGPEDLDWPAAPPGDPELGAAAARGDYRQLEVRATPPALRKRNPRLALDLSAIAKGYAVDALAYALETLGIRDYVVEIGGDLRTAGVRNDGVPWRIGLERGEDGPDIRWIVAPGNGAVASSGDYRNAWTADGRSYSHILDPVRRRPIDHALTAVSVIAPAAAEADALATLLMVLGPEEARRYAEEHETAALLTERTPSGLHTSMTPPFAEFVVGDD